MERTQVAILGGGPAGMLLSHMLHLDGVDSVVLERQSRQHVLKRIRAGVLEYGTVKLLRDVGLGERMEREGHAHDGTWIAWENREPFLIDTKSHGDRQMWSYGQTAITEELYRARARDGGIVIDEVAEVSLHDLTGDQPRVAYYKDGERRSLRCDYVAGCDGFHGVSRQCIPLEALQTFERAYPFGWLGVLSETPPVGDIIYAQHRRGFALASQRNANLSRYYIQCDLSDNLREWSDERFWEELKSRFPPEIADRIVTGPSIEKSIAPLRSFVAEPMNYGRLFLAGDAAHIVPPTGAKGLNLAVSDVYYLHRALTAQLKRGDPRGLENYSDTALRRVWGAERLSWRLTRLLHIFPGDDAFTRRIHLSEFDHLQKSAAAQAALAEQYGGLPLE